MMTVSDPTRRSPEPVWTEIRPASGWPTLDLRAVWQSLEIIYILALRDITVRYKQRAAGIAWAVLQPLLTMVVFTAVFRGVVHVPTAGTPYPVFALAALVPWSYFVHGMTRATTCLVADQDLITRVYFPRLVLPVAAVAAGTLDLLVAFSLVVILFPVYGIRPSGALLMLPLFMLFAVLVTLAIGLWLAAINVRYRDVSNALPFFTQLLLFVSPVAYPSSVIPEPWRWAYALNPLVTVIDGFRWALLPGQPAPGRYSLLSVVVVLVALMGGLYFFRWQEDQFADVV